MSILTMQGFHILILLSTTVVAYLDPGSGSFILQLILAALLGSVFVFKNSWKRLVTYIRKLFNKEEADKDEPDQVE